jgi:hypothetical protein
VKHWWLFRVSVPEGKLDQVVDLADCVAAPEDWYGITPKGDLLALRGVLSQDIYTLKCDLP